jgi:outer membrane receptor protein involved in Fe transport
VGNVITQANAGLEPETLILTEGGGLFQFRRTSVRLTAFTSRLADAVTNVTVSSSPDLIIRRRENAGAVRASGLEVEADHELTDRVSISGMMAFTRSRFEDTPGLSGNHVPQVPGWQGALAVKWQPLSQMVVQTQIRSFASQFEDDRNTLRLRSATLVDVSATRSLARGVGVFAAVENLFDIEYDTGRTPIRTVGIPLTVHAGVRVGWR